MSAYSLIAIILGTLAAIAAGLGYALGELRTERERRASLERQLRVNSALIARIAEDYDPPPEQPKRRTIPEGWEVHRGGRLGALLLPIFLLGAWLRRHWRAAMTAAGAAGAAAVTATALLAHGSPPPRPHAAAPSAAPSEPATTPGSAPSASRSATPTAHPKPSRTPLPTVPVPLPPIRSRRASAPASGAPSSPAGPNPTPTRPGPTPSAPTPSPTPTCFITLGVGGLLHICV